MAFNRFDLFVSCTLFSLVKSVLPLCWSLYPIHPFHCCPCQFGLLFLHCLVCYANHATTKCDSKTTENKKKKNNRTPKRLLHWTTLISCLSFSFSPKQITHTNENRKVSVEPEMWTNKQRITFIILNSQHQIIVDLFSMVAEWSILGLVACSLLVLDVHNKPSPKHIPYNIQATAYRHTQWCESREQNKKMLENCKLNLQRD